MHTHIRRGLMAASLLLIPVAAWAADTSGASGRIVQITVNEAGSDEFTKFRGSITVWTGKDAPEDEYKWGGSSCPGLDISAEGVDRLVNAFYTRRWTRVTPHYKVGQGGTKCLVGYELEGKANEGPG
jgi:hypothetical protein